MGEGSGGFLVAFEYFILVVDQQLIVRRVFVGDGTLTAAATTPTATAAPAPATPAAFTGRFACGLRIGIVHCRYVDRVRLVLRRCLTGGDRCRGNRHSRHDWRRRLCDR